ncbi:MAG: hypothetical protein R2726_19160 [Acidimicrobiales bacterium]
MPEDEDQVDRSEWLVPPSADEIRLFVELGENVDLTPEQTEALEQLVEALEQPAVSGFAMGGTPRLNVGLLGGMGLSSMLADSGCEKFTCNKHQCGHIFSCDTYASSFRRA